MKAEAGYTLLELLVVLAIMALLIAAIPGMAFPEITSLRFSGKVQEVSSRLAAAHERAIETGQRVVISATQLEDGDVVRITPAATPVVVFYPDGSSTSSTITVEHLGWNKTLTINPIDGHF